MSDQTNPTPAEGQVTVTPTSDTVTAEVCGAGCSYFVKEFIRDPVGDILKDANGNQVISIQRREARMGDVIELSPYEFARLSAPDVAVVQEPGSRPLATSPNRPRLPTPFGVPVLIDDPTDPDHGEVAGFRGPVMGDPTPTAGQTDQQLATSGLPLTAEQSLALELKARGAEDPEKGTDDTLYASYMEMSKEDLKSEADSDEVEVTRSDGRTDREPTKEDYARALADANRDPDVEEEV